MTNHLIGIPRASWSAKIACVAIVFVTALASRAQTFNVLHNFESTDPYPGATLVQGTDGNFYGTTIQGGGDMGVAGTAFRITADGVFTNIHNFDYTDAGNPNSLILGTDGNFYGTSSVGGANELGAIFRMTPGGTVTTIYSFCHNVPCTDGYEPLAGLVEAIDGNFYGVTTAGGNVGACGSAGQGCGTIFRITRSGEYTVLFSFNGENGAGSRASLILGLDGDLYGTSQIGGSNCGSHCGMVYKVTSNGVLTTVYNFCSHKGCPDGSMPNAGLLLGEDGNFYGTTYTGGINNFCTGGGCGTVFRLTPNGVLTTLYNFCSQNACTDGVQPITALIQGNDGNFYSTTPLGGSHGNGTAFEITPAGVLTTLHDFCAQAGCTDGAETDWPLVQGTDGTFYGTTEPGGTYNYGTAFSLSTGLDPFVAFVNGAAKAGQTVGILGQGFTGTTDVSFNGVSANFSVRSDTFLTAIVPTGAATGLVSVTTPGGTLNSNKKFWVIP